MSLKEKGLRQSIFSRGKTGHTEQVLSEFEDRLTVMRDGIVELDEQTKYPAELTLEEQESAEQKAKIYLTGLNKMEDVFMKSGTSLPSSMERYRNIVKLILARLEE